MPGCNMFIHKILFKDYKKDALGIDYEAISKTNIFPIMK